MSNYESISIRNCFVLLIFAFLVLSTSLFAQTSNSWTGQAQCVITVQGLGYSHQETQTWTVLGGAPTIQGAFRIYPGTWSVSGGGSLIRTTGTQTLQAQWTTNGSVANAPVAVFVRGDNHIILKSWHSQLGVPGGTRGTQQLFINGVPQTPGPLSTEVFEYQFPAGEDVSTTQTLSGSSTSTPNGSVSPMAPAGMQAKASCTWQYTFGASSPPGQTGSNPGNSNPGNNNPPGGGQNQPPTSAPHFAVGGVNPINTQTKKDFIQHLAGENTHWVNGVSVAQMIGAGGTAKMTVSDATHADVTVTVDPMDPSFREGQSTMTVTTGSEVLSAHGPILADPLYLGDPYPSYAAQGSQNVSITVMGGFAKLAVTGQPVVVDFGPGITVVGQGAISQGSSVPVTLNIDPTAATGPRDITIRSGALSATRTPGFIVTAAPSSSGGGSNTPPSVLLQVTKINPATAQQGQNLTVNLTGQGFAPGLCAFFGLGINGGACIPATVLSPASATVPVRIDPTFTPGVHTVGFAKSQPTGNIPAFDFSVPNGFTVTRSPDSTTPDLQLVAVTPNNAQQGQTVTIVLTGKAFASGMFADFGPGLSYANLTITSPTTATASVKINRQATPGPRNILIRMPTAVGPYFQVNADLSNAFTVNPAQHINLPAGGNAVPSAPLLGSCPAPPSPPPTALATPYCIQQGQQNVTLTLNATGSSTWPQGNYDASSFGGKGVTVKTVTWNSPTSLTAVADVSPNATLGPHSSFVSLAPANGECGGSACVILEVRSLYAVVSAPSANPLTSSAGITSGNGQSIAANAPPNVSTTTAGDWSISLSPTSGAQGTNKLAVTVTGTNTHFVQGTTLPSFGPGVGVSPIVSSHTSMIVYLHIPPDAPVGPVDVQIKTGAEIVRLPHGFTITPAAPGNTNTTSGNSNGSP